MKTAVASALSDALAAVDSERMLTTVRALSDERFGGRATGSAGQARARRWLVSRLRELGLRPQALRFPVQVHRSLEPARVGWGLPGGPSKPLRRWLDFVEHPRSAPVPAACGPVRIWDGSDGVRGAWVLVSEGAAALRELLPELVNRGARGVLLPQRPGPGGYLANRISNGHPWPLAVLMVREGLAERLLGGVIEATVPGRRATAATGVNLLVRSLAAEAPVAAVLLGAHYDAVGDDPDGTRFPGASDNASGVAVVLELARLGSARHPWEPPRRPGLLRRGGAGGTRQPQPGPLAAPGG